MWPGGSFRRPHLDCSNDLLLPNPNALSIQLSHACSSTTACLHTQTPTSQDQRVWQHTPLPWWNRENLTSPQPVHWTTANTSYQPVKVTHSPTWQQRVRAPEWSNKCSSACASKQGCTGTEARLGHSSGRSRWAAAMRWMKNIKDLGINYTVCQISMVSKWWKNVKDPAVLHTFDILLPLNVSWSDSKSIT